MLVFRVLIAILVLATSVSARCVPKKSSTTTTSCTAHAGASTSPSVEGASESIGYTFSTPSVATSSCTLSASVPLFESTPPANVEESTTSTPSIETTPPANVEESTSSSCTTTASETTPPPENTEETTSSSCTTTASETTPPPENTEETTSSSCTTTASGTASTVGAASATGLADATTSSDVAISTASSNGEATTDIASTTESATSTTESPTATATAVVCNIVDYGAIPGDNTTDVADAFRSAFTNCVLNNTNPTLLVPEGKFWINSPLVLEGKDNWKIEWLGSVYLNFIFFDDSYLPLKNFGATQGEMGLFVLKDLANFELDGKSVGLFDGQGASWWAQGGSSYRPVLLKTIAVRNGKFHGLTLKDSPFWSMGVSGWDLEVYNMTVLAPDNNHGSKNVDGIDPVNATNVYIHDSHIESGDDCVAVKNNVSNIEVARVKCVHTHGLSIGSVGIKGSFANVSNIYIHDSEMWLNTTTNGVRIKSWDGGSGFISNVTFENIILHEIQNPILVDAKYCDVTQVSGCPSSSTPDAQNLAGAVNVTGVVFRNIKGSTPNTYPWKMTCDPDAPCTDETIKLIDISILTSTGIGTPVCSAHAPPVCSNVTINVPDFSFV